MLLLIIYQQRGDHSEFSAPMPKQDATIHALLPNARSRYTLSPCLGLNGWKLQTQSIQVKLAHECLSRRGSISCAGAHRLQHLDYQDAFRLMPEQGTSIGF